MAEGRTGAAVKIRVKQCWACGCAFTASPSLKICEGCIARPAAFMLVPAEDLIELRAA